MSAMKGRIQCGNIRTQIIHSRLDAVSLPQMPESIPADKYPTNVALTQNKKVYQ